MLRAFQQDAPYLFLGSAFLAIGMVAIGLCALRRKLDPLLVWMGLFAALYGARLWLKPDILQIGPHSIFFQRLPSVIDFLTPIPGFAFFRAAGFLGTGKGLVRYLSWARVAFLSLAIATMMVGPRPAFVAINAAVVITFLWVLLVRSIRNRHGDRDFRIVRTGVLAFLILALWDNVVGQWRYSKLEPYGFAILLGTFGYVAARRTLQRDLELGEIQKELDLAQTIQRSILPGDFPYSTDFRVAARYVPMKAVAGDLYDYIEVSGRRAGLLIADVSGHGIPAALIASMVKMAAASQRTRAGEPAGLLAGMNAALYGNTQGQFVTAAYVHLDAEAKAMRYAAAGHPAMMLLRDGKVTEIAENGLVLAALEGAAYTERTIPLQRGDRLLLYTDGLVEARNAEGELLGEDAVMESLKDGAELPPAEAADRLIATAQQWEAVQDDDLTVVVCDFIGAE